MSTIYNYGILFFIVCAIVHMLISMAYSTYAYVNGEDYPLTINDDNWTMSTVYSPFVYKHVASIITIALFLILMSIAWFAVVSVWLPYKILHYLREKNLEKKIFVNKLKS